MQIGVETCAINGKLHQKTISLLCKLRGKLFRLCSEFSYQNYDEHICVGVNIYFCNHFKGLVVKNSNISNRKVTLINKFMDLFPM